MRCVWKITLLLELNYRFRWGAMYTRSIVNHQNTRSGLMNDKKMEMLFRTNIVSVA